MSNHERLIYLDNHATTPCDPAVVAALHPYFSQTFENPSSVSHFAGRQVFEAVEVCRNNIARLLNCNPNELVFTSGATESNNLAIQGIVKRTASSHVISSAIEHPSIMAVLQKIEREGVRVTRLPVNGQGLIDFDQLQDSLATGANLVSIMLANNEIGTLQDVKTIAEIARKKGIWVHTDATQAIGKIPVNVEELDVDMLSFSGHKIHGPKGIGVLYIRSANRRVRLEPLIVGGGQERGLRGGTLNVPGIVGLSVAMTLSHQELELQPHYVSNLRDRLFQRLKERIDGLSLNGPPLSESNRLGNNLNCQFPGVEGQTLMMNCNRIAMSSGSACSANQTEPSHVLRAIGLHDDQIKSSLRFGLSRFNTSAEIDEASELIAKTYDRLRG